MNTALKRTAVKLLALTVLMMTPYVVMAKSDNTFTKSTIVKSKGYQFGIKDASFLKIDLKDPIKYNGQPIYFDVVLENAKWLDAVNTSTSPDYFPGATFKKISDTKLEIKIGNTISNGTYYIPLLTELTGGEAKVSIESDGTTLSDMPFTTFAATEDQKAAVAAVEVKGVREEGVVGSIKIEEIIKGCLVESDREENRGITLTLLNPNYEFDNDKLLFEPSKGFSDLTGIWAKYASAGNKSNKSILYIQMPKTETTVTQGRITISDLKVKSLTKDLKPGKIDIKVSGPNVQETTVTVGEVKDYGVSVVNKSDKDNIISVGSKGAISFSIEENVLDSMVPKKTIEVSLSNSCFAPNKNAETSDIKIESIKLNDQDITKFVSMFPIRKDGFLTGFSFEVPGTVDSKKINKIRFNNVAIFAPAGSEGDVSLQVKMANTAGETNTKVAEIKAAASVEIQPIRVKVGHKDQVGGKITISETDRDMIKEGVIELEIENEEGLTFSKEPTVNVSAGDIQIKDVRYDGVKKNMLKIFVSRSSTKASKIEIKNFVVTVDGTVPDGGYKLMLKGSALAPDTELGALEYNNFLIVGDAPVVLEPSQTGSKKSTAKFIIDSSSYDVNGETRNMDAKAYVEDGKTMVPLRYVADAVGIAGSNIKSVGGVITLNASQKTVVLYNNQNRVLVNNEEMFINGEVITKDGRTYVPVAEIAKLLDVKVTWDASTRTAVFEK